MKMKQPITEVLRQAIVDSGMSFLALERETGVIRQSLMPFARGETGINLDAADKLAVYFGLELVSRRISTTGQANKRNNNK
jgi:plasmid maintenance system antidote protein VapI